MLTITHVMIFSLLVAFVLSFFYGASLKSAKKNLGGGSFFIALGVATLTSICTFLLFGGCEYTHLCLPLTPENTFHPFIFIVYFPVFWLVMIVGFSVTKP